MSAFPVRSTPAKGFCEPLSQTVIDILWDNGYRYKRDKIECGFQLPDEVTIKNNDKIVDVRALGHVRKLNLSGQRHLISWRSQAPQDRLLDVDKYDYT